MVEYFRDLGIFETEIDKDWQGQGHVDYMENLPENKNVLGRSVHAKTDNPHSGGGGSDLITFFLDWLQKHKADIRTGHRVVEVLSTNQGDVIGVVAEQNGRKQHFYGKKGVIFGSGGFSHNQDLLNRFHAHPLIGGCAVPSNTGDLIYMAQELGAQLGNMPNAYRVQSMLEVHLANPGGSSSTFYFVGDSFLEVNKYGKRVVNEKRNYNDRAQIHYVWDPVKGE